MSEAWQRDAVVSRIGSLVERARGEAAPVVWVQHSAADLERDSAAWQLVSELSPLESEPRVHKVHGDAFEGTDLEQVLARAKSGALVVVGAETDACIRSTIHGAFTRGYDVTLVGDAHTTSDLSEWGAPRPEAVIANVNSYWQYQSAPGRTARVMSADDVVFGGAPSGS